MIAKAIAKAERLFLLKILAPDSQVPNNRQPTEDFKTDLLCDRQEIFL